VVQTDHLLGVRSEQGHSRLKVQNIDVDDGMIFERASVIQAPDEQSIVLFQGGSSPHGLSQVPRTLAVLLIYI
jgi:hypothetical protein